MRANRDCGLCGKLEATDEGGVSLLDRTQVLYANNLGNASAHTTSNLPILLARMLQQMDVEADRLGSSTNVLSEV